MTSPTGGRVPVPVAETTINREVNTVVSRPVDLVRWGPIIAGIFAALATLATLTILGLAVGLSTYTPGARLSNLGIGAGIWAAISTLIAFGVGGWLAARSAAVGGHGNGILNGAMVWFVAIPLLLYVLGGGVANLIGAAGNVVGGAAQSVVPAVQGAATQLAMNPDAQATLQAGSTQVVQGVQATAQAVATVVTNPQNIENAADTVGNTAWGTLLSLGLAAAAAIGGGYLGARSVPQDMGNM